MADKTDNIWDEDTIPFQDGPEDRTHHKYRCQSCGFSEWIPAWVIDEFAWDEEPGVMPDVDCPNCGREMFYTGETEDRDRP